MSSIVIVGAGEQADLAYEYFTHDSPHEIAGFAVEAEYRKADEHLGLPVIDFEEVEARFPADAHQAFVAVSSQQLNRVRQRLFESTKAKGYDCASYVSSRAFVWHNVHIGENTFVFENNVLQHMVSVGDDCVLWSGNHVGHQTKIGSHCFITSHCVISGFCDIGDHAFLGVNCAVGDERRIGNDAVVGAGAVVVKDLDPRGVYVGNPAKPTGRDSFESFGVKES
jgi:sugar O-acyltransferase (sialic acid O-acetyltransferase NeuD family)